MKVADNRVVSVAKLFRNELETMYTSTEIDTFLFFALNEYAGFSRSDIVLKGDQRFSESELLKYFRVIRKLKLHVPIQYILGNTVFYGLKLKVNGAVLIPRPETEELVEWIVEETSGSIENQQLKINILDIGTGSGCIAVALKKNIPDAVVFALDVSEKALELAKENADSNKAEIQFLLSDILNFSTAQFSGIPALDIIVSNPPYIGETEKAAMHKNVLDHEPHMALFVPDNDPLLFYRTILDLATQKLVAGGKVYFELNDKYADEVAALTVERGFVNGIIKTDLSGNRRMFSCEKPHT